MQITKPKIIAIVGPTASGKTSLGIKLAKKFVGEIISTDSRQIYRGMDIGTAKVAGVGREDEQRRFYLETEGIRHYGINLVNPDEIYSVAEFKKYALGIIDAILKCGHLPFLVGGTGFYVRAIIENLRISKVMPDWEERERLEKKELEDLAGELKKIDPISAVTIDLKNKRRLIRALEVARQSGQSFVGQWKRSPSLFDVLQIGLAQPRELLYQRIDERVEEQIKMGLIEETKNLIERWYKCGLPSMTGIGYKEIGMFLRGEINLAKAAALIKFRTHDYARRQLTWFRKDKSIRWVKDEKEAAILVKRFLKIC